MAAEPFTCMMGVCKLFPFEAVWRNGSASDYESGGCSFEYYLGHLFILFSSIVSHLDYDPRLCIFALVISVSSRCEHELISYRAPGPVGPGDVCRWSQPSTIACISTRYPSVAAHEPSICLDSAHPGSIRVSYHQIASNIKHTPPGVNMAVREGQNFSGRVGG